MKGKGDAGWKRGRKSGGCSLTGAFLAFDFAFVRTLSDPDFEAFSVGQELT